MKEKLAKFWGSKKSDTVDALKIAMILILMIVAATILSNGTLIKPKNIENMLNQNAMLVLIALGQFLIILSGGADLSVGAVMAISSVLIVQNQNLGVMGAILVALAVALVVGTVNGILVTYRKLPPFIVTLAMMQIVYSLAKVLSGGAPIFSGLAGTRINAGLANLFQTKFMGISCPLIICLVTIIAVCLFMRTSYGRFIYAIGGNENTARMSGLPVNRVKIGLYIISSMLAALASVLFIARVGMGDPNAGSSMPMDSIAAVTIGGGSLAGGIGTVAGSIIGVYILSVLGNIMSLIHIPPTVQPAIEGTVILMAVYMNSRKKRV